MCDIVVRRNGRNDIGFRLNADKNYDCLAYEPGYMSSQKSINKALQAVYEPYIRGTTKKMMKNSPVLSSYVMGKTKEVDRNGKKMKRIRLTLAAAEVGSDVSTTVCGRVLGPRHGRSRD